MKVYCEGRRSYNTSFKIDIHVAHSETSRFTVIRKAWLKPGTEFTVHVTAFTIKGEGARSESVVVNTPSTGETLFVDLFNCIFPKRWKSFNKLRQTRVTCMHHSIPPVERGYFVTQPQFYHTVKQNGGRFLTRYFSVVRSFVRSFVYLYIYIYIYIYLFI